MCDTKHNSKVMSLAANSMFIPFYGKCFVPLCFRAVLCKSQKKHENKRGSIAVCALYECIWLQPVTFQCVLCAIAPVAPILVCRSAAGSVWAHHCACFPNSWRSIGHGWTADWHVPLASRTVAVPTWLGSASRTSRRARDSKLIKMQGRSLAALFPAKLTHFPPRTFNRRETLTDLQFLFVALVYFWLCDVCTNFQVICLENNSIQLDTNDNAQLSRDSILLTFVFEKSLAIVRKKVTRFWIPFTRPIYPIRF